MLTGFCVNLPFLHGPSGTPVPTNNPVIIRVNKNLSLFIRKTPRKSKRKSEDQTSAEQDRADGVAEEADRFVSPPVGVAELQTNSVIERVEERELFSGHHVENEVGKIGGGESERERLMDHRHRKGIEDEPDEGMCEGSVIGAIADQPKNDKGDQSDGGGRLIFVYGFAKSESENEIDDERQKHGPERH